MSKRYYGRETITSRSQVIRYLIENYVDSDQNPISEEAAMAACLEHKKEIDDGINPFRSNVHYVGDQIGSAMGWIELEEDEEDEDEDEEY
jgi:hypothetical protein